MIPETLLAALRLGLESRLHELRVKIVAGRQAETVYDAEIGEVWDEKDEAERFQRVEVIEAEERRDLDEAQQIARALQRIQSDRYGSCERCGNPIPLQRLLAQPAAERCLECQNAQEKEARRASAG